MIGAPDTEALRAEIESLTAEKFEPDPKVAREAVVRFFKALSDGRVRAAVNVGAYR